ncbi:MAG: hypothetical protein ABI806_24810 [Candidatus Solibacter sp.]
MNGTTERWIRATLANDEASSDAELVEHFKTEGGLSAAEAAAWVARRDEFMGRI